MSDSQASEADSPGDEISAPKLPSTPEFIQELPEEQRDELIQYVSEISFQHFSGPLPPPSLLNQYDPEVRRLIVNESVANRQHRTTLENRGQKLFFVRDILALLCAFTLALILIVGSIHIILSGFRVEGFLGIGGTVSLVTGAFLYRDHNVRKERKDREALQKPSQPPDLPDNEDKPKT